MRAAAIPSSGISDTWPMRMKLSGICGTICLLGLSCEVAPVFDRRPGMPS